MNGKKATSAYSIAHFVVDFSCAYFIFSKLHGVEQWTVCLLIYNFFAFAMQMPLGIVADRTERNQLYAAAGCVLVAVSSMLGACPVLLCIAAGLGNGLFDVGAGRDVLLGSASRFSALGIFVSPGAAGLYLGVLAGKERLVSSLIPILLLAASAFTILLLAAKTDGEKPRSRATGAGHGPLACVFMLLCLFIVVCLRSYVGMTLSYPWKGEGQWSLWLLAALVLGKALGGVLADFFGAMRVSLLTLLASAMLFVFYMKPVCGVLAVFFFNMSMPITLGAAARLLPKAMGFSFGLLTFGLFLGALPVLVQLPLVLELPWGYTAAALASALLLCLGLGGVSGERRALSVSAREEGA